MKRILIIGCCGAGKSTLAQQLGERLRLPVYHLDRLYWRKDWARTPSDEWKRVVQNLCATAEWIIDGNYASTMDLRLSACDTVIFLDYPRRVCLWRILKRRIFYHRRARSDIADGCSERITWAFLRWVWCYRRDYRPELLAKLNALDKNVTVLAFSDPTQTAKALLK